MISCVPSTLVKAARCFDCVPHQSRRWVRAFLLCKIANTSKFSGGGGGSGIAQLTGFTFIPNSLGGAIATWNAPPAGATATELWTSPDNITFSLDSTNPAPAVGVNTTAPSVGNFKWAKARWISATAQGPFGSVAEVSGRVCNWAARVTANGGSPTTLTERTAANTFDLALVAGSLDSQMIYVLLYVPSSLIGAITPLYKVVGSDPATNNGFAAGDLSINGLHNGGGNFLNIGANVSALYASATSGGISLYAFTGASEGSPLYDTGAFDGANNQATLRVNNAGNTVACMFASANQLTVASPGAGFYSINRVSAVDFRIFWGNSTNAFAQQGGTLAGANGATFAVPPVIPGLNNNGGIGTWSNHTHSGALWHNGLTLAQATTLFNAYQAFRVAIGGGSL